MALEAWWPMRICLQVSFTVLLVLHRPYRVFTRERQGGKNVCSASHIWIATIVTLYLLTCIYQSQFFVIDLFLSLTICRSRLVVHLVEANHILQPWIQSVLSPLGVTWIQILALWGVIILQTSNSVGSDWRVYSHNICKIVNPQPLTP